jgi:hypothetical protein
MAEAAASDGFLRSSGEAVGGFLSKIPAALSDFFSGVGDGAGIDGLADWVLLVLGLAMLLSVVRGVRAGRIVGPVLRGLVGVALLGWAVA